MKHLRAASKSRCSNGFPGFAVKGCQEYEVPIGKVVVQATYCEGQYGRFGSLVFGVEAKTAT